jgi:branched-chain amino acid aminotransferase
VGDRVARGTRSRIKHSEWHLTDHWQIPFEELKTFDEILAAGTAAALVPIKSITLESQNDKLVVGEGSDEPGPVCTKLLTALRGHQQGKLEDKFGWLLNVDKPALWDAHHSSEKKNGSTVDELP